MAPKLPTGSTPSAPHDPRPRAQVAYEGEDEFSQMSLAPERQEAIRQKEVLKPGAPGYKDEVRVQELKSVNENGIVSLLRRIFAK